MKISFWPALLIAVFLLTSCNLLPAPPPQGYQKPQQISSHNIPGDVTLRVMVLDSCEYVYFSGYKMGGGITHKGNCKNHRE